MLSISRYNFKDQRFKLVYSFCLFTEVSNVPIIKFSFDEIHGYPKDENVCMSHYRMIMVIIII